MVRMLPLNGFATLISICTLVLLGLLGPLVFPNTLCPLGPMLLNQHILLNSRHFLLTEAQLESEHRVEQTFLMPSQTFYLEASTLLLFDNLPPLSSLFSLFNQYFLLRYTMLCLLRFTMLC